MNSTVQCLSATYPFSQFFLGKLTGTLHLSRADDLDGSYKRAINVHNKLGTKGNLANAWSELLKALWREDYTFLSPVTFRVSLHSRFACG
jgi:ubiquitin carboxyl-terminal hydrolase 8